jgi:hypothetical protein
MGNPLITRSALGTKGTEFVNTYITVILNLLGGHYMYHQIRHPKILLSLFAFIFCVWISEQTAFISLYIINWSVFITEKCAYCAVRIESLYIIQVVLQGRKNVFLSKHFGSPLSVSFHHCSRLFKNTLLLPEGKTG